MTGRVSLFNKCEDYFTKKRRSTTSVFLFVRGLALFAMIKVITLWSVADTFFVDPSATLKGSILSRAIFFPSELILDHPNFSLAVILGLLVIILVAGSSYLSNFMLFWIVINLFRVKFPVTNGSDYVLLVMCSYAVPLSQKRFDNAIAETVSISMFNLFRLLACIQVALIYLISAWDKLLSPVWRNGDAFVYIGKLDIAFNPVFAPLLSNEPIALALSWITIGFELLFGVLVWQERTRLIILCIGIVFHIVIWMMLSLPDFALIMIISYLIFLKDEDLQNLRSRFRLQPR